MLETFNPRKHDAAKIAELIYDADPEFNGMIFGDRENGVKTLSCLTKTEGTFYSSPFLKVALEEGRVVGVVSGYPLAIRREAERNVGIAYVKVFGLFGFLKKLPLLLKMNRVLSGKMAKKGFYIVYLCVDEKERGKGIGTRIITELRELWPDIFLHVSRENTQAIRFYEWSNFQKIHETSRKIKEVKVGAFLMRQTRLPEEK
jgi:ribosomal protein S18 acetylase RimI-like enzyme